eukprot:TRINITY_DN75_c0_g1_i4.p1 TRINITY_DN75_c0_g1~~TRINITY_DN75_c0_g1_i4.p1  ORF type:complete len:215 (-),score=62.11 TRINITY_DN75_c0_g1_i4:5-649(-)
MVKVYIDVITGDEMVSDGYPNKEIFNGAGLEVQARFITKGQDDGGIAMNLGEDEEKGADAGGMPEGETVIDIVDRFDLKETKYDKKSFQAYVKVYLNKIKKYLQDKGKAERVPEFQKGVLEMVKMILKNFDDFQFFYRQLHGCCSRSRLVHISCGEDGAGVLLFPRRPCSCLLYTSDAADDSLRVDLGGRRIIKKKKKKKNKKKKKQTKKKRKQ